MPKAASFDIEKVCKCFSSESIRQKKSLKSFPRIKFSCCFFSEFCRMKKTIHDGFCLNYLNVRYLFDRFQAYIVCLIEN